MTTLQLLPAPQLLERTQGTYELQPGRRIVLLGAAAAQLFSGQRLQGALRSAGVEWQLAASEAGSPEEIGAILRVVPGDGSHPQGYELEIGPAGISVTAHDGAGLFYAVCTLAQIVAQRGTLLPCLRISDWPDFAARGVMLDVSRDKVPQLATLRELLDMLAGWKINQVQLYTEHTFAYRNHPEVWADASPLTGQDILELDMFCRERQIELVPNQNSFGHMHRWLKHPRYTPLAEVRDGYATPWGAMPGSFSLAPVEPGSMELIASLYDELLPHFSSPMFNVGCDETFDLGQGRSKAACEERGAGRVYLDFLLQIHRQVSDRGRTMQFWGDIIIQHPELIAELPGDAIALEWGYEADHPFAEHCPQFAAAGIPFYVCPGTSSWCSVAGRTDNAAGNLRSAAEHGLRHGAIGYLNTDWGDLGHWQALPVSYLGFVAGAAYSWAFKANQGLDIAQAVSLHGFGDPSGAMGRVAYDLGNVYRAVGVEPSNGSLLFWLLQGRRIDQGEQPTPDLEDLRHALETIDAAMEPLASARMNHPDGPLIREEWTQTARMLRHGCNRGLLQLEQDASRAATLRGELNADLQGMLAEHRRLWLARNRPGGLRESAARLEQLGA